METGADTSGILPCRIVLWKLRQEEEKKAKNAPKAKKKKSGKTVVVQEEKEERVESDSTEQDVFSHVSSACDFRSVPFGIEPSALMALLNTDRSPAVAHEDSSKYTYMIEEAGVRFSVLFFFNTSERLYRYDILGDLFAADSINTAVRTQARLLKKAMVRQAGKPIKTSMIGLFDLKKEQLSPMAWWQCDGNRAWVGIIREDNRYRARTTVMASEKVVSPGVGLPVRAKWITKEEQ